MAAEVWIVYTEYQNGDPSIVGVFAREADAIAARDAEVEQQETELNNVVYGHVPDGVDPDEYDEADWDVDVHVERFEVFESFQAFAHSAKDR